MQVTGDQFYLFTMPGDATYPVWCESFSPNGAHTVAPMPVDTVEAASASLRRIWPAAVVDELRMPLDIANAREWARTMPLEQIPA